MNQKGNTTYLIIIIVVGVLAISGLIWFYVDTAKENNQELLVQQTLSKDETVGWPSYWNNKYGFGITLLDSWKGYSAIEESWSGYSGGVKFQGPQIVIRNPKWTENQPWQDIPIMVFTKEEWTLIEEENLGVSAAPIGPSKLGENQKYVFALPPRWVGFTDDLGQDEAEQIAETFTIIKEILGWKTYKNEGYGFEFKYPVSPEGCEHCKIEESNSSFYVNRTSVTVEKLIDSFENYVTGKTKEKAIDKKENTMVDGREAIMIDYRAGGADRIAKVTYIKLNDYDVIKVNFTAGTFCCSSSASTVYELDVYQAILSTFKFINFGVDSKEYSCINSGGKVIIQTCYCDNVQDFYNDGIFGGCACTLDPKKARQIKSCDCSAVGKYFDGTKCSIPEL